MAEVALGFEPEVLARRLDFLLGRADAHVRDETDPARSHGLAATLLQDAAAVCLIAARGAEATQLLERAGALLIGLGIPYGHVLLALGAGATDGNSLGQMVMAASHMPEMALDQEPERFVPPLRAELAQPAQLLALVQATLLQAENTISSWEALGRIRERLQSYGTLRMSPNAITIGDYLRLCDWLASGTSALGEKAPREALFLFASLRSESMRAARADEHHWRRLLGAAQLVDFPATVLFTLALRRNIPIGGLIAEEGWIAEAFELPIKAAFLLGRSKRWGQPLAE